MPDVSKAKRVHIAIAVDDVRASVEEYTARLGTAPCVISSSGDYALFLTPILNFSVSASPGSGRELRHFGFEYDHAPRPTAETDGNGFVWEHFTLAQQAEEIRERWPGADWAAAPGQ